MMMIVRDRAVKREGEREKEGEKKGKKRSSNCRRSRLPMESGRVVPTRKYPAGPDLQNTNHEIHNEKHTFILLY